ncbi:hypothetical protein KPH14_002269 [Odynerus spinipes]|uniref:Serpin domain-containing protein n=1 Tax=Odynerus spinipes TaxID=1348599 RepID=A0AAD9VPC6_9HYME|nr:hypothetical protein KPH14_002269 [Odynerus spinipes]
MRAQGFLILAVCLSAAMAIPTDNRAVQTVTSGINQFSSAFYADIAASNPGNLITSPLSAAIVLSMAGYGSREETKKEFEQVLHLPEESVGRIGYSNLIDIFNNVKTVQLSLANKAFVNKNFSVKPSYQQLTQSAFRSTSESLDFSNTAKAAATINQWCEEQTNHRIKDLIEPDSISGGTAMVLVNAVYFKGNWLHKFDAKLTEPKPFHATKTKTVDVPTMHKVGHFKYANLPELKASLIEIPYEGRELSMVIILPDEIDGLPELERKLAQADLAELIRKGYNTEVSLQLPKFTIESSLVLTDHLKHLGLKKAFSQTSADFSGISDAGVFISAVVQKAFIEVNEEGSEAAAATAITATYTSALYQPPPRPVFNADHPFYYNIIKSKPQDEAVYLESFDRLNI